MYVYNTYMHCAVGITDYFQLTNVSFASDFLPFLINVAGKPAGQSAPFSVGVLFYCGQSFSKKYL